MSATHTMHPTNHTESPSNHEHLEQLSTVAIVQGINEEDATIAGAVQQALPAITRLIDAVVERLQKGGRLFYIGAGTSGRLGILDASEIPPSYGVHGTVIGIIAGGDHAIREAVENAEDDLQQAWTDMQAFQISVQDVVVGIAASGTTPYVLGGLQLAKANGIATGCIVCNAGTPIAAMAHYPIELITGPEFVTGSTRMKAGTAQKMVLNMISTASMIRLGKVKGNRMVEMELTNEKLRRRAINMLMEALNIDETTAIQLLQQHGSVKQALQQYQQQ